MIDGFTQRWMSILKDLQTIGKNKIRPLLYKKTDYTEVEKDFINNYIEIVYKLTYNLDEAKNTVMLENIEDKQEVYGLTVDFFSFIFPFLDEDTNFNKTFSINEEDLAKKYTKNRNLKVKDILSTLKLTPGDVTNLDLETIRFESNRAEKHRRKQGKKTLKQQRYTQKLQRKNNINNYVYLKKLNYNKGISLYDSMLYELDVMFKEDSDRVENATKHIISKQDIPLTDKKIAEILGVTPRTIQKWKKASTHLFLTNKERYALYQKIHDPIKENGRYVKKRKEVLAEYNQLLEADIKEAELITQFRKRTKKALKDK